MLPPSVCMFCVPISFSCCVFVSVSVPDMTHALAQFLLPIRPCSSSQCRKLLCGAIFVQTFRIIFSYTIYLSPKTSKKDYQNEHWKNISPKHPTRSEVLTSSQGQVWSLDLAWRGEGDYHYHYHYHYRYHYQYHYHYNHQLSSIIINFQSSSFSSLLDSPFTNAQVLGNI